MSLGFCLFIALKIKYFLLNRYIFYADLGSLIGSFELDILSTEWKFSKNPATLILREINFG